MNILKKIQTMSFKKWAVIFVTIVVVTLIGIYLGCESLLKMGCESVILRR